MIGSGASKEERFLLSVPCFCTATSYLSLRAVEGAPRLVTVRKARAECQPGRTGRRKFHIPEQEGRTGDIRFSES